MGGYGSTRWTGVPTRYETGECLRLDAQDLKPYLRSRTACRVIWGWPDGTRVTLEMAPFYEPFEVTPKEMDKLPPMHLNLSYTIEGQDVEQSVPIDPLPQHFGGWRPWMRCPDCQRRCKYLYMPREGPMPTRRFACRLCHRLTYRSSNLSRSNDPFVALLAKRMDVNVREARRQLRLEGFAV